MTTIKVGDIVEVTNPGQNYSTFQRFADRNGLRNYKLHNTVPRTVGKVIAVADHTPPSEGAYANSEQVAGIEIGNEQYIVGVRGLRVVEAAGPEASEMLAFKAASAKVRATKAAYETAKVEMIAAAEALVAAV
jgi:hypothetical protein